VRQGAIGFGAIFAIEAPQGAPSPAPVSSRPATVLDGKFRRQFPIDFQRRWRRNVESKNRSLAAGACRPARFMAWFRGLEANRALVRMLAR